jgi:hypothetical protein
MTQHEEIAPFASVVAMSAMHSITRDEDERDLMAAVFEQLSVNWAEGSAFDGCHLAEAGISVDRMVHAVRGLARRRLIGADVGAWLKDQLVGAAAEIEGEGDPELYRIRALKSAITRRAGSGAGEPVAAARLGDALTGLRAAEAKRVAELKVVILGRCEERRLAALLVRDKAGYESMAEAGEPSVTRLMRRAA